MFGVEMQSNNGKRLLMSEAAHLEFIGKAHSPNTPIYLKDFVLTHPYGTLTGADEVRWFDMFIEAEEPPLCFVYSASEHEKHGTGITHIYEVEPGVYGIALVQAYVIGSPLAVDAIDVYCFTRPKTRVASHGLELKDRNGKTTFHSDMKFLSVRGFAEVPHWSSYAGYHYAHGIPGLSKPAIPSYSNIAALAKNYYVNTSGGGCRTVRHYSCTWSGGQYTCSGYTSYVCNYTWSHLAFSQTYKHIFSVTKNATHQIFAGDIPWASDHTSNSLAYPAFSGVTMPVIDGADYD